MAEKKRVFVSSTYKDLEAERLAVEGVLKRMRDTDLQMMEYWGSREETPLETSLRELEASHVYLGIFASRYGTLDPATGMSITEREYRRSLELRLPHLIYFKAPDAPVPPGSADADPAAADKLQHLKAEIAQRHTVDSFRTPEELGMKVATALHNLFLEQQWARSSQTRLLSKDRKWWLRLLGKGIKLAGATAAILSIIITSKDPITALSVFLGQEVLKMWFKDLLAKLEAGEQVSPDEVAVSVERVLQRDEHALDELLERMQALDAIAEMVEGTRRELRQHDAAEAQRFDQVMEELRAIQRQLAAPKPPTPPPFQAPNPPETFVGREAEQAALRQRLLNREAVAILGLRGMGGIGKTALAARLAHELRGEFPDGVVWCEVGDRDPLAILADMARAYGVEVDPRSDLAGREAFVRDLLSARRALVVLDDVRQANLAHLPRLLPPPSCAGLVTSRLEDLPGVSSSLLEVLDEAHGLELLRRIVGRERVDAEPDAARRIHGLCGGLPLALDIAAQRLAQRPPWTLASFAERLQRTRLAELERGETKELNVRASFRLSYAELEGEEQQRYRALGAFGTDFSVAALLRSGV